MACAVNGVVMRSRSRLGPRNANSMLICWSSSMAMINANGFWFTNPSTSGSPVIHSVP
jgi:hypothetical protein